MEIHNEMSYAWLDDIHNRIGYGGMRSHKIPGIELKSLWVPS